jgi:C4-dicarboxylate-specific signal transduction histidine kinase
MIYLCTKLNLKVISFLRLPAEDYRSVTKQQQHFDSHCFKSSVTDDSSSERFRSSSVEIKLISVSRPTKVPKANLRCSAVAATITDSLHMTTVYPMLSFNHLCTCSYICCCRLKHLLKRNNALQNATQHSQQKTERAIDH